MPWNLTTAVSTGDLADSDYAQVKIVRQLKDSYRNEIKLELEYGNTVDGNWIGGMLPNGKQPSHTISGQDYADIKANAKPDVQTSDPEDSDRYFVSGSVWVERTWYAAKRALYEELEDKGVIAAGSVAW